MKEQEHEAFGACIEKHFPAPTPPTGTAPSAVRERERLLAIMGECFQAGAAWQRTQSAGAPEGWRLVPEKLTEEMALAGYAEVPPRVLLHSAWKAMLAAAPAQPAAQEVIDKPARIGATVFRPGVSVRTVIERAYRQYEYVESNLGGIPPEALDKDQGEVQRLREALASAEKNERHRNNSETRYWCDQYKQLARAILAASTGQEVE